MTHRRSSSRLLVGALLVASFVPVLPGDGAVALPDMPLGTSDDCDDGTNVVTGYLGTTYVKLRTAAGGPDTTLVCVAVEDGTTHLGGKVAVNGTAPSAPVDRDEDAVAVAACAEQAGNLRVQSGTVLGQQPYWLDVTPLPEGSADIAWVCVRFTAAVGFRLRFSSGGAGSGTGFVADPPTPRGYADGPWPAAGPSAECQSAAAGTVVRDVNVALGNTRIGLYRWIDGPRTHVCMRAGPAGSGAGGRLTVDGDGDPGFSPVVTSVADVGPCPFDIITRTEPPPTYGVYVSDPEALSTPPVSACVAVATFALGVTVGGEGPATGSWRPDPS